LTNITLPRHIKVGKEAFSESGRNILFRKKITKI